MVINDTIFNVSLMDVLTELRAELQANQIDLLGVIRDTPDNVMVACPYHKDGQERKPSMGISKKDGVCHCFACETVVTLPQMISHCFGDDSQIGAFGWNWLLKNFLTVSVEERKELKLDFSRGPQPTQTVQQVTEEELDTYRYNHPYWTKRKITNELLIELFDLGFDPQTDCVTMPVRDGLGHCLFVARRATKTKYFNYPRGAEKPVYGLYEIRKVKEEQLPILAPAYVPPTEIIICESMIDALTAWQYGKYAVALNGLGTQRQFRELREYPCRKYILATDADSAGMRAREKIKQQLPNKIVTEYLWDVNVAKDLNDMTKEQFDSLEEVF